MMKEKRALVKSGALSISPNSMGYVRKLAQQAGMKPAAVLNLLIAHERGDLGAFNMLLVALGMPPS